MSVYGVSLKLSRGTGKARLARLLDPRFLFAKVQEGRQSL